MFEVPLQGFGRGGSRTSSHAGTRCRLRGLLLAPSEGSIRANRSSVEGFNGFVLDCVEGVAIVERLLEFVLPTVFSYHVDKLLHDGRITFLCHNTFWCMRGLIIVCLLLTT